MQLASNWILEREIDCLRAQRTQGMQSILLAPPLLIKIYFFIILPELFAH